MTRHSSRRRSDALLAELRLVDAPVYEETPPPADLRDSWPAFGCGCSRPDAGQPSPSFPTAAAT